MKERAHVQSFLDEFYSARVAGRLDDVCGRFSADARLRIAGASDGKSIAIEAHGLEEIRSWLAMLVKTFRLARYEALETIVDGERAAVHWRADVHSRITGTVVPTELVDIVQVRDQQIASYIEWFVPC